LTFFYGSAISSSLPTTKTELTMAETKAVFQQLFDLLEISQGYGVAKRHGHAVLKGDRFSIRP